MRTLDQFHLRSLETGRWVGASSTILMTVWADSPVDAKEMPASEALHWADHMRRVGNHVTMQRSSDTCL